MGTSSLYTGPSDNPLLPEDFNDSTLPDSTDNDDNNQEAGDEQNSNEKGNNNEQNQDSNEGTWSNAKTFMSKIASGSSKNYKRAFSNYVKAHGGAKNATKTAKSGIRSTVRFRHFLSSSSTQGIRETLSQYHIDYEGRAAKDILVDLINYLAPVPLTKEDSVARKALIRTLEILYEKIEDENNDINTLDKIDVNVLNEMIPIQIESYIYERIINDLGSRIETNSSSPADAINIEQNIREYINSKVETALKYKNLSHMNFRENIRQDIESLYEQCYKVMEDML
jgi:hypothetical protein